MKYRPITRSSFRRLSLILVAAFVAFAFHTMAQRADAQEVQLIVKLKPSIREADFKRKLNARGATQRVEIRGINARVIRAPKASVALLIDELERDANIDMVTATAGGGGFVLDCIVNLTAATHTITVGAGSAGCCSVGASSAGAGSVAVCSVGTCSAGAGSLAATSVGDCS